MDRLLLFDDPGDESYRDKYAYALSFLRGSMLTHYRRSRRLQVMANQQQRNQALQQTIVPRLTPHSRIRSNILSSPLSLAHTLQVRFMVPIRHLGCCQYHPLFFSFFKLIRCPLAV